MSFLKQLPPKPIDDFKKLFLKENDFAKKSVNISIKNIIKKIL